MRNELASDGESPVLGVGCLDCMDGRAVVKYLFGSTSSRPRMWWLGIGPSATVTGKHSGDVLEESSTFRRA